MRRLVAAATGVWEFIAGDDWLTAVGVVAALGLTALLSESGPAWFVMPCAVAILLVVSIWREARKRSRARAPRLSSAAER
jgi:membrane protein implicated in regulation of membrane protease activity